MKQENKQKEQGVFLVKNIESIKTKEPKDRRPFLSLKENKTLLSYLMEEKELTEQEVRTLKKYRRFHFKSKRDMGGPRQIGSQEAWFTQGFKRSRHPLSPFISEDMNQKEAEGLQKFRQMRRQLLMQYQPTLLFIEALFEHTKDNLESFKQWPQTDRQTYIKAFKFLAKKLIGLF